MPSLDRASSRKSVLRERIQPVVTLGLAMTATATELVVVRGNATQGSVIDRVVTEARERTPANGSRLQQAVDNVLQTQALAIAHGYHVHAVGVVSEDSRALIAALKDAGLERVSVLDPVVAREIFTQPESTELDGAAAIRARSRRRWIFITALVVAVAALTFAIVDRWQATPRPAHQQQVVTPTPPTTTTPPTPVPVVEAPPPPPPTSPTREVPPPSTPEYTPPPRRSPVQQAPTHRPSPPPAPAPPPAELPEPEPEPTDNCMFLCGVSL